MRCLKCQRCSETQNRGLAVTLRTNRIKLIENIFSSENNDFEQVLGGVLLLRYVATVEAILNHTLDDTKPSEQQH